MDNISVTELAGLIYILIITIAFFNGIKRRNENKTTKQASESFDLHYVIRADSSRLRQKLIKSLHHPKKQYYSNGMKELSKEDLFNIDDTVVLYYSRKKLDKLTEVELVKDTHFLIDASSGIVLGLLESLSGFFYSVDKSNPKHGRDHA